MAPRGQAPDVRAYRKDDKNNVAQLARVKSMVLAIDPGANGIALLFSPIADWGSARPPAPRLTLALDGYGGLDDLAIAAAVIRASPSGHATVVIEDSFAGGRLNPASDTALARSAGAAIGALCALSSPDTFDVVFVMEKTWFWIVGRVAAKVKRDVRKQMTAAFTVNALGGDAVANASTRAGTREAFCDAYAMAAWWGQFVSRGSAALCGTK